MSSPLHNTGNEFQVNYSVLRYVGPGTASGVFTLSASPMIARPWVTAIYNPNSGGSFTVPTNGTFQIGFSVHPEDYVDIPGGSYTVTAIFSFTANGATHTVSYSWSYPTS